MKLTRRRMLKAGMVASLSLPWNSLAESARRVRVGFLGIAHSHFKEKLQVLKQSEDFELVGLCEENVSVRDKGPINARWISRAILMREAEVIVVEGTVQELSRNAADALREGKHVHVEKPPAASMSEFRNLVNLARRSHRLLQVGYMWRHNPGFNRAFEAARNGWLGDVFLLRATMNTQIPDERRQEWATFRGGAMFEQGSHLVDAAVRLLGRPRKVTSFLQRRRFPKDRLADNTVAVLEFSQAMAILTSAPLQPNAGAHRFLEILGTGGTALVQPIEPPALVLDLAAAAGPYVEGRQGIALPEYHRYVDEFRELAHAVRSASNLSVSLEEERVIQETLLKVCGS